MDAKQLEEDVGASPRSFGGPSNDTKHVKARKASPETRARMSQSHKRFWGNMTAEERKAERDRRYVAERKRLLALKFRKPGSVISIAGVDSDFDELGF